MKQILIVSSCNDAHVHHFLPRIRASANIEVLEIQTEKYFPTNTASLVSRQSESALAYLNGKILHPFSVWYRRPIQKVFKTAEVPRLEEFIQRETELFWVGMFACLPADTLWISKPLALLKASIKALQLQYASETGFLVPETMMTNNSMEALQFCESLNWQIIAKTLGAPIVYTSAGAQNTYVRKLTPDKADQLSHIQVCPVILQRCIEAQSELRVTVIGEKTFAVSIASRKRGIIDWRALPDEDLEYADRELPESVRSSCVNLVHRFDLNFSTMDILHCTDGQWYFLDLNPNGQWLWLDKFSQQGMADYFMKFLLYGTE